MIIFTREHHRAEEKNQGKKGHLKYVQSLANSGQNTNVTKSSAP